MNSFLILSLLLSLASSSSAFAPIKITTSCAAKSKRTPLTPARNPSTTAMYTKKPSGSFFNQVPADDDNKDKDDHDDDDKETSSPAESLQDPFDQSIEQLMKNRRSKPLASSPSTLGGVPTSKATGFGKTPATPQIINTKTSISSTQKSSFVGIGKPLNDVNKPEYDDQGYTLYADEQTGKKSRVFEALVDYPSIFKMKIIGRNESTFSSEMVQIVAESCQVDVEKVDFSERVNGKWLSVTVHAPVESAEMLYSLYENVDKDPRVKFKF